MIKYITLLIALLCVEFTSAQYAYFGTRGKIQFDKVTFTRARMRDMMSNINNNPRLGMGGRNITIIGGARDINNIPESSTQKMDFYFDENQSLLLFTNTEETGSNTRKNNTTAIRPGGGGGQGGGGRRGAGRGQGTAITVAPRINMRNMNSQKVMYQNLSKGSSEIQLSIDEKYILSDSLSAITWRFTDEYRNIAGYECRRVNGATKDSLYLVAYYTDQIPVSGGPALVHGLPGMVLGLAIPEMHIQYWATEVSYTNDAIPTDWRDKKSKSMSLDDFSKSFGQYFQRRGNNDNMRRRILEQLIY